MCLRTRSAAARLTNSQTHSLMRVQAGIPYDICVRATKSELVSPSCARLSFGRRASGGCW
jgi:hypothetical protein